MNLDELKATVLKPYSGARQDRLQALTHLDAGESAFLQLQLTYVELQWHVVKHKPLRASLFIPVTSEAPTGADTIRIPYYDLIGRAKIVHDYASDFPEATSISTYKDVSIKSVGSKFSYSVQDIRKAQMAGLPLEQRKADAARRAVDELIDNIAWLGDSASGLTGLLNATGVNSYTVGTTGTSSSTLWSAKTPDNIIADVTGLINTVRVATNGKETPDTLLLPMKNYNYIAMTRVSSYSDKTILTYLKEAVKELGITKIDWVNELVNIGSSGTVPVGQTYSDRMIAFPSDPNILRLEIPQPFEMYPPQLENLVYNIPCHARTAGVLLYYPLAVVVGDGI